MTYEVPHMIEPIKFLPFSFGVFETKSTQSSRRCYVPTIYPVATKSQNLDMCVKTNMEEPRAPFWPL